MKPKPPVESVGSSFLPIAPEPSLYLASDGTKLPKCNGMLLRDSFKLTDGAELHECTGCPLIKSIQALIKFLRKILPS